MIQIIEFFDSERTHALSDVNSFLAENDKEIELLDIKSSFFSNCRQSILLVIKTDKRVLGNKLVSEDQFKKTFVDGEAK